MHSVYEIDVRAPWRPKDNTCPIGDAAVCVRRLIVGSQICLYLYDHSGATMV
jgi:hypothetical protein